MDQQSLAKKWATLSQAEKYSTKMQEVPFRLYQDVSLDLDITRADGKDVREFASKQNISVSLEHARPGGGTAIYGLYRYVPL